MGIKHRFINSILSPTNKSGCLILCFHDINLSKLVRWLRLISQHFQMISLTEFIRRRENKQPLSRSLVVTFDDGWRKVCETVAEVCEKNGWPATVYIPSGLAKAAEILRFIEANFFLREAAEKSVEFFGRVYELKDRTSYRELRENLGKRLAVMDADGAMLLIDSLRAAAGLPAIHRERSRFVDRAFLERYAKSKWIDFGSHTIDHRILGIEGEDEIQRQLSESKSRLEEILNKPVEHFCYPGGDPQAIGEIAPRMAKKYYRTATTLIRGVCTQESDPWFLPRIALYDIDNELRFLVKLALARWF